MHRVFGQKEDVIYRDRKGAYLIPINGEEVGIVETAKGFFFLGGGINERETDKECIIRECMEEAGYKVKITEKVCSAETYCVHPTIGYFHPTQTYYLGELTLKTKEPIEADHLFRWINYNKLKGKMFLEMQNWALDIVFDKR
ncbi:MAG: NUDIX domain-containing protein [Lachnospiraceae bacterium]|nr:NUDIX domain-containing protein [Lachnospiraceae bacterium]